MAKIKKFQVPFDSTGKLITNHGKWPGAKAPYEWRDNEPFKAVMTFQHIYKGPYSDRFVFHDVFDNPFEMTSNYFVAAMKFINRGILVGTFQFTKWHGSYCIAFVEE